MSSTVIDNDYHPIDSGLGATDDHWGTVKVADVTPILSARKEEYQGQRGVINSTGELAQHLNNSPMRKASDRTNIVPLRIGK